MELIPAILPKTFAELEEKVGLVRGLVDTVQIDFCDGRFVPNATWPFAKTPQTCADFTRTNAEEDSDFRELVEEKRGLPFWEELDYEFDLMIANPAEHIADFVRIGARRVYVHIESIAPEPLSDLIHEWKSTVEVGLALKIETPLWAIDSFAHEICCLQLMGIAHIGRQGEPFDERVVARTREAHARYPHLPLAVDGGVSLENARSPLDAGANRLVVGSAIFGADNPRAAIEKFKKLG